MNRTKKIHLIFDLITVIIFVLIDLCTKHLAVINLKSKPAYVLIDGVFELRYLENTGAAFSMFRNKQFIFLIAAMLMILLIVYAIIKMPVLKRYLPLEIVLIAIFAGAVGNMYDRIINGYVVDFLYFSLINFPIFNVADIYVSVATVILAFLIIFYYKDNEFDFLSIKKKEHNEEV